MDSSWLLMYGPCSHYMVIQPILSQVRQWVILDYGSYIRLMWAPTILTSIMCAISVYWYFRNDLKVDVGRSISLKTGDKTNPYNEMQYDIMKKRLMVRFSLYAFRNSETNNAIKITQPEHEERAVVYVGRLVICLALMITTNFTENDSLGEVWSDWSVCLLP
eukprot:UN03515